MTNLSPIRASGLFFAAMYLVLITEPSFALQDGQSRTPPMGWNDWYFYECDLINEPVVLGAIAAFTKKHPANWEGKQISLKDVGYSYLCIDDCWGIGTRNAAGNLQINTAKFPRSAGTNSFKWLGDTLHRLGLKFGIYTSDGTKTCQQVQPGACNHEDADAAQFASWAVDFIKDDCCFSEQCQTTDQNNKALYYKMSAAIKKTGRPMVLSLCDYGKSQPWVYGDEVAHLWRTNGDFAAPGWSNVMNHADQNLSKELYKYAKPGAWNDPDIMQIAVGSLTAEENRSHFSLWCIMTSPLLLGNDLSAMTDTVFSIVSNREAIAVNQDSLGVEGHRVRQIGGLDNIDIHVKPMKTKSINTKKFAVLVLNRAARTQSAAVKWSDFGETNTKAGYAVRDLWKHENIATHEKPATDSVRVIMPGHGCAFLTLTKGTDTIPPFPPLVAIEKQVPGNNRSTHLATRRCASRGMEVFIPDANSMVQIFNVQGKMAASFSVPHPSWHRINDMVSAHGIFIVRVKPLDGLRAKEVRVIR